LKEDVDYMGTKFFTILNRTSSVITQKLKAYALSGLFTV